MAPITSRTRGSLRSCPNEGMMKGACVTAIGAWAAHALAWIAGLWFVFAPSYQGVSVTSSIPGEPAREVTRHTATLVEVNGLWVLWLLLIPILFSGLALLALLVAAIAGSGKGRADAELGEFA